MSKNKEKQIYFGSKDELEVFENITLSELTTIVSTKNKDKYQLPILTVSALNGLVSQDEYYNGNSTMNAKDIRTYVVLNKNDFSYNKSYSKLAPWGACKRLKLEQGLISSAYISFNFIDNSDNNYFEHLFTSNSWHRHIYKISQEGARNHGMLNMTKDDFFKLSIKNPKRREKIRTSKFLSQIDNFIFNSTLKVSQLSKYNTILQNSIFKENNKNLNYSQFTLSEITKCIKSKHSLNSLKLQSSGYKIYDANKNIGFIDTYDMESEYITVLKDGAGAGRIRFNEAKTSCISTMDYIITNENSKYLYYYLKNINLNKYIVGSTIPHIYYSDYKSEKIFLPNQNEQKKISQFLSQMDKLIEIEEKKLELLEKMKKYHLQQFFD